TEINVEAPVAVVVGDRGVRECSLRGLGKLEGVGLDGKFSISLIDEQQRAAATDYQEILKAAVLKIRKQRASGSVRDSDAGSFRHIFKCAIAAIAIKAGGKSRKVADIKITKSVIAEVSGGQAAIAVDVDADSAIQKRAPVVHSVKHLVFVGVGLAESLLCDIDENGLPRAAEGFFGRGPAMDPPARGVGVTPFRRPIADALLALRVGELANQVIANVDAHVER